MLLLLEFTSFLLNFSHWELPSHLSKAGDIFHHRDERFTRLCHSKRQSFMAVSPCVKWETGSDCLRTTSQGGTAGTLNTDCLEREQLWGDDMKWMLIPGSLWLQFLKLNKRVLRLSQTGHSDVLPESPSESREEHLCHCKTSRQPTLEGGECARKGRCYPNVTDGCEQRRRKVRRRKWGEEEGSDTSLWGHTEWVGSWVGWLLWDPESNGGQEREGCWVRVPEMKKLGLGGRAVIWTSFFQDEKLVIPARRGQKGWRKASDGYWIHLTAAHPRTPLQKAAILLSGSGCLPREYKEIPVMHICGCVGKYTEGLWDEKISLNVACPNF